MALDTERKDDAIAILVSVVAAASGFMWPAAAKWILGALCLLMSLVCIRGAPGS